MEYRQHNIRFLTILLTLVAGYCDTLTFVAANKIFSAHVTGNFIIFAYQFVAGANVRPWASLLTFPVFLISIITGGWIINRFSNPNFLFFCEGIILLLGGNLIYWSGITANSEMTALKYLVTMMVVFAMGIQNAAGKIFANETYGPTTVMTGNVTEFALHIELYWNSGLTDIELRSTIVKGMITMSSFLTGCVIGAYAGKHLGLAGIVLPGIIMIIVFFCSKYWGVMLHYEGSFNEEKVIKGP